MQRRLILLLSSLGLFIPACHGASDDLSQGGSALDSDPDLAEYFASKDYAALDGKVSFQVREVLTSTIPDGPARGAMLALFRSPKWLMLGSAYDPLSCPTYGVEVQTLLLEWIKASQTALAGETGRAADERTASNVAGLKRVLSQQNVTYINGTMSAIETALSGSQPGLAKTSCGRPPPSTDGGVTPPPTKNADGGVVTPTTAPQKQCTQIGTTEKCWTVSPGSTTKSPPKTKTHASIGENGAPAGVILADMFAQAKTAAPSRGLLADWDALRARWQKAATRAATSPVARDVVREARRAGSTTIARQGARASLKFDQGAALVDHFVAARIEFSADAMNAVHAVVADRAHGRVRRAGENVQAGSDRAQAYLPGAEVEGAVASLFAGARRGAKSGLATPELAATFDQRLISIHPFLDANGRTTRLMTDWLLLRAGYPPVAAGADLRSAALFWQKSASQRDREAHLARITTGMQRTLSLVEGIVA